MCVLGVVVPDTVYSFSFQVEMSMQILWARETIVLLAIDGLFDDVPEDPCKIIGPARGAHI